MYKVFSFYKFKSIMNLNSLLTNLLNGYRIINSEYEFIFKEAKIVQILKEDVRKKIIEIGKKQFEKKGFENTSIKDIAEEAGVSTGNIYRYFLTKKHLLNEILIELEKEIEDFFSKIPSEYKDINLNHIFDMVIEFTLKISKSHKDTLNIMFKSQNENQFIVFKEKVLDLFTKKLLSIAESINSNNKNKNICEAIARAQFEGLTHIVKNNLNNINQMKKNLEIYKKLMVEDLGTKAIKVLEEENKK